ncbi:acyltransferase domain-containing protein [Sinimarinibacterium sp. CAU 1509]|uniref:type I polyketide synthase n=1 Tax=Sinimarinibacterium sp. CAU 1509 TaxID=2562283 RepID=UPI0010ABD38A|nr:type I polyketide synthase [Sinimarinibacterium sp. CAU 1509]TJY56719.1 acyltransferase domain-containing protein [Sinimarinibacterium sp. CAU 1509]
MDSKPLDIAIIGMAGRYAGARNVTTFWQNILNKVYSVTDASPDWAQPYLDPDSTASNRIYTSQGGWLHDLAEFDPREFGVMPNAVDGREPDHFLALQNARDALADSGYLDKPFNHERAGIVLGRGNNTNRGQATLLAHGSLLDQVVELVATVRPDFSADEIDALREGLRAQLPPFNPEMLPGLIPNITTGIIANRLDLMGPNYIVDAACASSLVAIEHAARELRSGRCDLMLSGGVHAQTPPQTYMIFSQINALARDQIRPFQKGANGTLLGEGCGVLVLKRLEDAERDGDRIYAVIKGIGVASDGKAKGLFAPRQEGQVVALRRAYESCGIDPATIGLIEAHATGIALGDRTEVRSLSTQFGARDGALPRIALGSVKSMISHAIPASGAASMIKMALSLYQKVLPPTLCDEPAPELELEKTPFYINNETRPWIHDDRTPRRAGVDAFGFGGINAHVILEEYRPSNGTAVQVPVMHAPSESELVVLGAASRSDLLAAVGALRETLQRSPLASLPSLAKACAERSEGEHRLAIVAADKAELLKRLEQAADKLHDPAVGPFKTRGGLYYGIGNAPGKVCVLFPGEGAQYTNMLADVCVHFPQARSWFDFLESTTEGRGARAPVIFPVPTTIDEQTRAGLEAQLHEMDYGAESVFTASMALYEILSTLGLQPDAMLGHSTGENTALTASRVRRFENRSEIADTVRDLNRIYRDLDEQGAIVEGALLTVGALKPPQREALLARADGKLQVAMDNCPNQLVLFGSREDIHALKTELSGEGAICVELPFGRAYHTELFKPIGDAYRRYFASIGFGPGVATLYSACSVGPFPDDADAIRELVASQWESRVRFTETVQRLYDDGYRVFVEAGPSGNLTSFVSDILRGRDDVIAIASNSRRKSGISQLQHALAQLYTTGVAIDPRQLFAFRNIDPMDLEATPPAVKRRPSLNLMMPKLHWPESIPVPPLPILGTVVAPSSSPAQVAPAIPVAAASNDPRSTFLQTHFALMQEFLDSQARVLGLAGAPPAAPDAAAVPAAAAAAATSPPPVQTRRQDDFPMLGTIVEQEPTRLVIEREFSLSRDLFLRDHTIGGAPSLRDPDLLPIAVIPFTFSMEILAEAAMRLIGRDDRVVVAIEQSRGNRWLSLDDDSVRLRIVAVRDATSTADERVNVRIFMLGKGPQGGMLVFEGTVLLAEQYPPAPAARPWSSSDEFAPANNPDGELYSHGMFHGPRLQGVKHVRRWGSDSIEADLEAIPTHDYFSFTQAPHFQFDAAMLDAAGQLAGYWLTEKHTWGFNCFPFRLGRFSLYGPPPAAGTRVICRGDVRFTDETILEAQFDMIGADGAVIMRADGWEDRKFAVPQRLYEFRIRPDREFMTQPYLSAELPPEILMRQMEPFPQHFLDEGGAIWKRMLAHMLLSHAERRSFYALPQTGPRREEWLMGRAAAKDVVRDWAASLGVSLCAADIEIANDADGAPRIVCPALHGHALPTLSISHSRYWAVAALAPAGTMLGLDYQRLEGIDVGHLSTGGLSEAERPLAAHADHGEHLRRTAALWCAKEAAAKAVGTGLQGRPLDWTVTHARFDSARASIQIEYQGQTFDIDVRFPGPHEVVAVCRVGQSVLQRPRAETAA